MRWKHVEKGFLNVLDPQRDIVNARDHARVDAGAMKESL